MIEAINGIKVSPLQLLLKYTERIIILFVCLFKYYILLTQFIPKAVVPSKRME